MSEMSEILSNYLRMQTLFYVELGEDEGNGVSLGIYLRAGPMDRFLVDYAVDVMALVSGRTGAK